MRTNASIGLRFFTASPMTTPCMQSRPFESPMPTPVYKKAIPVSEKHQANFKFSDHFLPRLSGNHHSQVISIAIFCWVHFIYCTLILGQNSTVAVQWLTCSSGALFNPTLPADMSILLFTESPFLGYPTCLLSAHVVWWSTAMWRARTTRRRRPGRSLT